MGDHCMQTFTYEEEKHFVSIQARVLRKLWYWKGNLPELRSQNLIWRSSWALTTTGMVGWTTTELTRHESPLSNDKMGTSAFVESRSRTDIVPFPKETTIREPVAEELLEAMVEIHVGLALASKNGIFNKSVNWCQTTNERINTVKLNCSNAILWMNIPNLDWRFSCSWT